MEVVVIDIMMKKARIEDLPRIVEIYNSTVESRMVTADTSPVSVESRAEWFNNHTEKRPIFLFLKDDEIVGWLSFSDFYSRPAYQQTAEVSIYLDERYRGQGIGNYAVEQMKLQAKALNITTLLAFIFQHNTPSIKLFEKHGFVPYGTFPDVAQMDGQLYSLSILGFKVE